MSTVYTSKGETIVSTHKRNGDKSKFLPTILGLVLFSVIPFFGSAQSTLFFTVDAPEPGVEFMSICDTADVFTISIANISGSNLDSIIVAPDLPLGINYVPGSIFDNIGDVNGVEADISDLNNPTFKIGLLADDESSIFSFRANANCDAIALATSGVAINFDVEATYYAGTTSGSETKTTNDFEITKPILNVINIVPPVLPAYLNGTFSRKLTVSNGGNGPLDSFQIYSVFNPDAFCVDDLSYISTSGDTISLSTTLAATGDTIFANINPAQISDGTFNAQEHPEQLNRTEFMEIVETVTIKDCSVPAESRHHARWGCGGEYCEDQFTPAGVSYNILLPDLVYNRATNIFGTEDYTSCFGEGLTRYYYGTNIGDAPASLIRHRFHTIWSDETRIDAASIRYRIGKNGTPEVPIIENDLKKAATGDCFGLGTHSYVVDVLADIILNVGDTIFWSWDQYSCCDNNVCGAYEETQGMYIYSRSYYDGCQLYRQAEGNHGAWVYRREYVAGVTETPTDIATDETSCATFTVTGWDVSYPLMNSSCNNCYYEFKYIIGPGLDWDGDPANTSEFIWRDPQNDLWEPDYISYTDHNDFTTSDTLVLRFNGPRLAGFNFIGSELLFKLKKDCVNEQPECSFTPVEVTNEFFFVPDPSTCTDCRVQMNNCDFTNNIRAHCPGGCPPCTGITIQDFKTIRYNYDLPDNNNDSRPDAAGTVMDTSLVKQRRLMVGDTLLIEAIGSISTTEGLPPADDTLPYFEHVYFSLNWNNPNYEGVGANVEIYDYDEDIWYNCTVDDLQFAAGNNEVLDLCANSLRAVGCGIPIDFVFEDKDTIKVNVLNKVNYDVGSNPEVVDANNSFFASDEPYPSTGRVFQCNSLKDRFTLFGSYKVKGGGVDRNFNGCVTTHIYTNNYIRTGNSLYANFFPFEFRPFFYPNKTILEPIPGYDFKYMRSVYYYINPASSSGASTFAENLNLNSSHLSLVNGDLVMDHKAHLDSLGWEGFDEAYRVYTYAYFTPTCLIPDGVQQFVPWTHEFGFEEGRFAEDVCPITSSDQSWARFYSANLQLDPLPKEVESLAKEVCWDVRLFNASNSNSALHSFINTEELSGLITIDSIYSTSYDINTGETTLDTKLEQSNGLYELGTVGGAAVRYFKIFATNTSCDIDSIMLNVGWNCPGYPNGIEEYPCDLTTTALVAVPQPAELQMKVLQQPMSTEVCSQAMYELELSSGGKGYLYDVHFRFGIPDGFEYLNGSFEIEYPIGSGYFVPANDPVNTFGNNYQINISEQNDLLTDEGMIGATDLSGNYNRAKVRFTVETGCESTSGGRLRFFSWAYNACGAFNNYVFTSSEKLVLEDVPIPYETVFDADFGQINPCIADSTMVEVSMITGFDAMTGAMDSITAVLPEGFTYLTGSYNDIQNALPGEPDIYDLNGLVQLKWKLTTDLGELEEVLFEFAVVASDQMTMCGESNPLELYSTSPNNVECVASGEDCLVQVVTGDGLFNLETVKPQIDITSVDMTLCALPTEPYQEELRYTVNFENIGEDVPMDTSLVFHVYSDADNNNTVSGSDVLLTTFDFDLGIANGASSSLSETILIDGGNACNLLVSLDTMTSCICMPDLVIINDLNLKAISADTTICSIDSTELLVVPSTAYTYEWSALGTAPISALSDVNIANPIFYYQNNSGATETLEYQLITNRGDCQSYDTMAVTVYPYEFSELTNAVCLNNSYQLNGPAGFSDYIWSPAAGLDDATLEDPTLLNLDSTVTYTLSFVDNNGCPGLHIETVEEDQSCVDLELEKTASISIGALGEQFSYVLQLVNKGPGPASDILVADTLPSNTQFIFSTPSQGFFNSLASVWNVGDLAAGDTATLEILVEIDEEGTFYNCTEVSSMNELDVDSETGNGDGSEDDQSYACVTVPQTICGNEEIALIVPPIFSSLQWQLDGVDVAGATSDTLIATTAGVYEVSGLDHDGNPYTYCEFQLVEENCPIDLELEKTVFEMDGVTPATMVSLGDTIKYQIVVSNRTMAPDTFAMDANGVEVFDNLPTEVSYVSYTKSTGTYSDGTGIWDVGIIENGTTDTLCILAEITSSGTISNVAEILASDQPDVDSEENNDDGDQSEDDEDNAVITVAPCDLVISNVLVGDCNPSTGTYDLSVTISYSNNPNCPINLNSQTFLIDGSGSETFVLQGLLANGATDLPITAFFTCLSECSDTDTYDAPNLCSPLECTISGTDVLCNGGTSGTATVVGSGGSLPYTYAWSNGANTDMATGLSAGPHTVTITDADNTETICSITLAEPSPLTCGLVKENDISCNGLSDGSATVTAGGGFGGYSILWSTGETTTTAVNLVSGLNSVTITDGNNCTQTCTIDIIDPAELVCAIPTVVNPACPGSATGSLSVDATGGTGVVEYSLNGGPYQPGSTFIDLPAGDYTVMVKDANGCTNVCSATLTDPDDFTCSIVEDSPASCGMANGMATVTAVGGDGSYTYEWDNLETTAQAIALSSGVHMVTVTDGEGCETSCSVVIMTATGLTCQATKNNDVLCNGDSNGSASVLAVGGTSPYTYLWSNGETTATVNNLDGGTHSVTITDSDGCTTMCMIEIEEPTELVCEVNFESGISCAGEKDGSATVVVMGGTPNYTYVWESGETTATAVNLAAGKNGVTITDLNGCKVACSIELVEPKELECRINETSNPLCFGDANGWIEAEAAGGTGTLLYSINGSPYQPGGLFSDLPAGEYTITIIDDNGCETTCSASLTEPKPLICDAYELIPASCEMNNGSAQVKFEGGTGPYTILWDNLEDKDEAIALSSGIHTVTVTDANGCEVICSVEITSLPPLTCEIVKKRDVSCNGAKDGRVGVEVQGGSPEYTFLWSNGNTNEGIEELSGGVYSVTITDKVGCTVVCQTEILEAPALICEVLVNSDISCYGEKDASATVSVMGGTPNYTFEWTSGETTSTAVNLAGGKNSVIVTDMDGCKTECTFDILEPKPIECKVVESNDPLCFGESTGNITVDAQGGTGILEFSVDGSPFQIGTYFDGLNAGIHTVTVQDENGCQSTCEVELKEPLELTCVITEVEPATCGLENGSATVIPTGGTAPYNYLWDNLELTKTAVSLSAGLHMVTVTDANGCETVCSWVISNPEDLTCSITDVSHVTCHSLSDGEATVVATGGTSPYTYNWSNGATTNSVSNFVAGDYLVTVTDAEDCEVICSVTITEPNVLLCEVNKESDISCHGAGDGSASISVMGGTPNYSYLWTSGETGSLAISLEAGVNNVTVTDMNGCEQVCSVEIIEPEMVECQIASFTNPLCAGTATGTITVAGNGGGVDLVYSLNGSPYQPGELFENVPAGMHTIGVMDENGCMSTCEVTLEDPEVLTCTVEEDDAAACGLDNAVATVTAVGGTGTYTYLWDNLETTQTASSLSPGLHMVTVTDENGCETECSVLSTSASDLACEIDGVSHVSCNGLSDGEATVTVTGGSEPYTYLWSNGANTNTVTNFSAGLYTVTATDADDCEIVCEVTIEEPTALLCEVIKESDITCNGLTNGSARVIASGGTENYTYLWSSGETTSLALTLVAGNNTVTVTDMNGCESICNVDIVEPESVSCAIISTSDPICFGSATGSVSVEGAGGIGDLVFSVDGSPYQPGVDFDDLTAGDHVVSVMDENGCESSCNFTLTDPAEMTCAVVQDAPTACGLDNGAATVTSAGGTGSHTYLWDNLETGAQAVALSAGVHMVTVTDENDCTTVCSIVIMTTSGLTCEMTKLSDVICNGDSDGSAIVEAMGGNPPYAYAWSNGSVSDQADNLAGGQYTVTITDADNCETMCMVEIFEPTALLCEVVKESDVSCFGNEDGSASIIVMGGVSNYTYLWSNGETTAVAVALPAGSNSVTVTDMNACESVCTIEILESAAMTCSLETTPSACMGQNDGTVTTTVVGGTAPFEYAINGGINQTGGLFENLAPGFYTVVVTDANGCMTDCDIEVLISGCEFDLALIKELTPGQPASFDPGDDISFTISVCNQGQIPADNITVIDYVPAGLSFDGSNAVNIANGWSDATGDVLSTISVANSKLATGGLQANDCVQLEIVLNIDLTAPQNGSLVNAAEITSATDDMNNPVDDIDSTEDNDNTNDGVPIDDEMNNGSNDEDDHDIAVFEVNYFDLALTKTLATGQVSSVAPNDIVTYSIVVYNQGTIAADNVEITDYIPACMQNVDANWTGAAAGPVTRTLSVATGEIPAGGLLPGDFVTTTIDVQVLGSANMSCDLTNYSEISNSTNTNGGQTFDIDSDTDNDPTNDIDGGNDELNNLNGDEDDHDGETISLLGADLALAKDLAAGQAPSVAVGQDATFTITVINQGSIATDNIEVADYLDACMSLNDAAWSGTNPAYYTLTVANGDLPTGGLLPGAMATVDITVTITCIPSNGILENNAEIVSMTDEDGNPLEDTDSDSDDNPNNDLSDEDDNDGVTLDVLEFDLALTKDLAAGQSSIVAPGSDITYDITILNEGQVAADNVEVTDYIPTCMSLNDGNWTLVGNNAVTTLSVANGDLPSGGIPPMGMASVQITLTLDNPVPVDCNLNNWAEISNTTDEYGNPQTDIDSTPDGDNSNDPNDEDDIDDALVSVLEFDLALTKDLAVGQDLVVAPGDDVTFDITILNQGSIPADNILVTDYIPSCMVLNDTDWTASGSDANYTMTVANGDLPTGGLLPNEEASVQITLTILNPVPVGCSLTNWAEISEATDQNGGPTNDVDSDPDADNSNDPYGEDDLDSAEVSIFGFDLAITKDLAVGQAAVVAPGDDVTFDITILNQGNIAADNILVTDYIPSCMVLNDNDWTAAGSDANYTMTVANGDLPTGGLLPNEEASVQITLTILNPVPAGCSLTNWAEISAATDQNGGPTNDVDSDPDADNSNDPEGEDDIDDAEVSIFGFDLAITKDLAVGQAAVVAPGDDVTFDITILNQGNIAADNILVTDYIPSCMVLNDTDWTAAGSDANYTMTVANGDLPTGGLLPNEEASIQITLRVLNPMPFGCDLINWAEISAATNQNGGPTNDVDSDPDADNSNDPEGEDDIDYAEISVLGFDLAITKDLATNQAVAIAPGEDVTYDITVLNQGNIAADNILVTDYIPNCMTLNDANWTPSGTDATYTMSVANGDLPAGGLLPNEEVSVQITLTAKNPTPTACDLVNWAEISAATDDNGGPTNDIDSDPDGDNSNDPVDEDDIDQAEVTLLSFDLALTKDLSAGQDYAVAPGDYVSYDITVINQGDIAADNIVLTDYIPSCMALKDLDWTASANGATYTMSVANGDLPAGGLEPGDMASVEITLAVINPLPSSCSLINWAEINSASDENGGPTHDIDSDPDGDNSNDPDGEDDIDFAEISILGFDLALSKDLANGQSSVVAPGDDVVFDITILNQGDIAADQILITDYIPNCMTLNDSRWSAAGNNAEYTMSVINGDLPSGGLLPGEEASVQITLQVLNPIPLDCNLTNWAEISNATDDNGGSTNDIDSDPDGDNSNDPVGEDDIDDASVTVLNFDLALSKDLADGQSSYVVAGADVTFDITVINQGNIFADNIEVTDYIPSCMNLNDSDWSATSNGASYTMSTANGDLPAGGLAPGSEASVEITLQVINPMPIGCSLINWAEISNATDDNGGSTDDVDSDPDADDSNDPVGEDDIDHEEVFFLYYDLALIKNLANGQASNVMVGDDVHFTFTVINQGLIAADNIEITDYIPSDFALNDANWSGTNPAVYTLSVANGDLPAGGLLPGDFASVDITLTVLNTEVEGDTYINKGEISGGTDIYGMDQDDVDSYPDNIPFNDPNGEDDVDTEPVTIDGECDLALIKHFTSFASAGNGTGGQVTFTIEVINQGTCTAYDIGLVDYNLESWNLNDNAWYFNVLDGHAYTEVPGPLTPGNSLFVDITFDVASFDPNDPMINYAEIMYSKDFNGDYQDDEDSTPNINLYDDGLVIDDNVTNFIGDEDDHDLEYIEIIDLALDKNIKTPAPYAYGDIIEFEFAIENEGNATVLGATILDNIPASFSFNAALNPDWTGASPAVNYEFTQAIAPGQVVTTSLFLTFSQVGNSIADYTNTAEITEVIDNTGNVNPNDWDSTPSNDDGDQSEDDEDAVIFSIFDLALTKTSSTSEATSYGQVIDYDITVYNQGSITATNIELTDYIPCGLSLVANSAWSLSGSNAVTTIAGPLAPGQSIVQTISLQVEECATPSHDAWANYAEISASNDLNGVSMDDIDSQLDNDENNDGVSINDAILNESNDEDDHDGHLIELFDLSIDKEMVSTLPYAYGDLLEFSLSITNEGQESLYDVQIVDHVPPGLNFDVANNSGWQGSNPDASYTFGGEIVPGQTKTVSIYLSFTADGDSLEDYTNTAEITAQYDENGQANDSDIDSNVNNDDGDQDEDDEDAVIVELFDLALEKSLITAGPYRYGDELVFEITVVNEGSMIAENVKIVDYLPCGFEFVSSPGWTVVGDNLEAVLAGPIMPGEDATMSVTVNLQACGDANAFLNEAEIKEAFDAAGNPANDYDSEPDDDNSNDVDEDDRDGQLVEVFDLALQKLVHNEGPYLFGDIVEFTFVVFNQGSVPARDIVIGDYLSPGYAFNSGGNNAQWSYDAGLDVYANLWKDPTTGYLDTLVLMPGASDSLHIYLEVQSADNIEDWINYGEIIAAKDTNGMSRIDADSEFDAINENDILDGDNEIFGINQDEDDHDLAQIIVTGDLGDYVWKDLNGDGVQDDGEPGVADVIVHLFDCDGAYLKSTTTDANGFYLFDELLGGSYQIQFVLSNLTESCAITVQNQEASDSEDNDANLNGFTPCIELAQGEHKRDVDAGLIPLAKIGNYVWEDCDGDGIQDASEDGISNIRVDLYFASNDSLVGTTYTNNSGAYLFDEIYPGDYYAQFSLSGDYEFVDANLGGNDNLDSDADGSNGFGTTQVVSLSPGECDESSADAGLYKCLAIGDLVWFDTNNDGIWDAIENGVNGIKVEVFRNGDNGYELYDYVYTGHKPGTPSDDGYWKMCVPPGEYYIKYGIPLEGLYPTQANQGNDESVDSDITGANGENTTSTFSLSCGLGNCDIGAGLSNTSDDLLVEDEAVVGIQSQNDDSLNKDEDHATVSKISTDKLFDVSTKLYPNPTIGAFTVEVELDRQVQFIELNIMDAKGNKVISNVSLGNNVDAGIHKYKMDGSSLPGGMYYVQISLDNTIVNKRLIKLD